MKAAIITIGDEILIGQIVDTNSAWMANTMTKEGFEIEEMASIGDDAVQIKSTISDLFKRVDVILTTGGLGPTKDDITKKTLCEYFDTSLVFDDAVLENIKSVIPSSMHLNELTRNQAYVPKDCTVIQNRVGTAPITWFETNGKVLVSMPGVPYEMRYNMEHEIIPRLHQKYELEAYLMKSFIVGGFTESALAIHISDFEDNLPQGFGLAYLPSLSIMKLRLFVRGEHRQNELDEQVKKLKNSLGDAILAERDMPIEAILGECLMEKGLTIGTAESCTGGNIARLLTSIAGSSTYFKGSIVSYSNEVKTKVLGVPASVLETEGAVSEACVTQMATGAAQVLGVDCSIAVSGIAGPGGGSDDKPVGTVWIATYCKGETEVVKYTFAKLREANIIRASNMGMLQLFRMLNK